LRRVLGFMAVAQSSKTEPEHAVVVPQIEVTEGHRIAGLTPLHEGIIRHAVVRVPVHVPLWIYPQGFER
jgi:hypothetical protein